ncbi:MAG TPA: PmoA family protein [Terracidiphilus sp.]|nr:PmoA family protein [Terracidiphilus sp.]
MKLISVEEIKGCKDSGTIEAVFQELDPAGKGIMTETRTVTVHVGSNLRIIDYGITVYPVAPTLKFGDTKEGTFGIRLATSMTEDSAKGGRTVNAKEAVIAKNIWGKRSEWVDYDGSVDGKTVGVAIFDTPSNPRYPTYWHTRAYGLDAANPFSLHDFLHNQSHDGDTVVECGRPVHFQYRVVIHDGDTLSADIPGLYKEYVAEKK